jgi:hypothetical protein
MPFGLKIEFCFCEESYGCVTGMKLMVAMALCWAGGACWMEFNELAGPKLVVQGNLTPEQVLNPHYTTATIIIQSPFLLKTLASTPAGFITA